MAFFASNCFKLWDGHFKHFWMVNDKCNMIMDLDKYVTSPTFTDSLGYNLRAFLLRYLHVFKREVPLQLFFHVSALLMGSG